MKTYLCRILKGACWITLKSWVNRLSCKRYKRKEGHSSAMRRAIGKLSNNPGLPTILLTMNSIIRPTAKYNQTIRRGKPLCHLATRTKIRFCFTLTRSKRWIELPMIMSRQFTWSVIRNTWSIKIKIETIKK